MSTTNETAKISTAPAMEHVSSNNNNNNNSINMNLLTMDNPVFCCWLFWCSVLTIKMLLMSLLTAIQRLLKKTDTNNADNAAYFTSKISLLWNLLVPITKFGKIVQLACASITLPHRFYYFLSICFCGQAFANTEDAALNKVTELNLNDPDVERVRRAHLNDLENILPLLIISLAYITTNPNMLAACILLRIAAVSRILHTLVYAFRPVPQPARSITFFIALSITIFMAIYTAVQSMRFI